jgi:putative DNA methylase
LICRPWSAEAATGDWGDVLRALTGRVADWMARLQAEGVRGADLVFACVGWLWRSLAATAGSRPPRGAW